MDSRQARDLDNYITGHYGEDQFKGNNTTRDLLDNLADEVVLQYITGHTNIEVDGKQYRALVAELAMAVNGTIDKWLKDKGVKQEKLRDEP